MNRLRESQMISSIFPKYSVVVFVIVLYFVAGSVLISYYVTAAVVGCAERFIHKTADCQTADL